MVVLHRFIYMCSAAGRGAEGRQGPAAEVVVQAADGACTPSSAAATRAPPRSFRDGCGARSAAVGRGGQAGERARRPRAAARRPHDAARPRNWCDHLRRAADFAERTDLLASPVQRLQRRCRRRLSRPRDGVDRACPRRQVLQTLRGLSPASAGAVAELAALKAARPARRPRGVRRRSCRTTRQQSDPRSARVRARTGRPGAAALSRRRRLADHRRVRGVRAPRAAASGAAGEDHPRRGDEDETARAATGRRASGHDARARAGGASGRRSTSCSAKRG